MSQPACRIPELLAPAGGPESLRAAVANGADAVYLGVDRLNARRGAENFTLETLDAACEFAHLRGTKVYLTANVLVLPDEMESALTLIDAAWSAGVDAAIIQDPGLMRCVREELPNIRVHASTQMNAHSSSTIEALAAAGAKRVTLARETSLQQIGALTAAGASIGVEVESFVHGALCVCYSGQCLLSSLIGGRSANRGQCAQPCRLTYELIDGAGEVLATPGAHLLSPKDLAGITLLPDLIRSGVDSLKIEGRMKSPEYVAIVTGVYRAALDRAAASPDTYTVRDGEMAVLSEAFSRGFTEAYLAGERGNSMMSYQRPNNRGLLAGRIESTAEGSAAIRLETALASDDVIEVWTGRGRFAQSVGPILHDGVPRDSAPSGARVRIALEEAASSGDRVFRVRNAALLSAAARTFQGDQVAPVPVDVSVRLVAGEPLAVGVTLPGSHGAAASGSVAGPARTKPVTVEDVIEHVGRFGGSGFVPHEWDVVLSPGVGIGFSELHRVRRDALDALKTKMLGPWADRALTHPRPRALPHASSAGRTAPPRLVAVVADLAAANACLAAGAEEAHVPVEALDAGIAPDRVTVVLPRICPDGNEPGVMSTVRSGAPTVAGTLGLLSRAAGAGSRVQAHWSLNALNPYTVAELAAMGASMVWLSPELSADDITRTVAQSPVPTGIAIAGRQEVMVTEHCVLMAQGECSRTCGSCARRRSATVLRDRLGYEFPVRTDASGRTHIFNSVPLDLTPSIGEVLATGVSALRLDLETETAEHAAQEVRRVRQILDRAGADRPQPRRKTTSGHFHRGVS